MSEIEQEEGGPSDHEVFFWGLKGQPTSFIRDLFIKLKAHSPEIAKALQAHLSSNPNRKEPMAFDGTDAGAMLLLHLLEAIVSFEQLKHEVLAQPSLSPSKGRVPAFFLIAQSDLLSMEPVLLHLTHLAYASRCQLWEVEPPDGIQPVFVTEKAKIKKLKAERAAKRKARKSLK